MSFKLKAIVCDDSNLMRRLLSDIIQKENFEVVAEAGDGIAAIKLVGEHKPNLLTLDISMPGMDGIEALKEIKRQSPDTKVVMVTAIDNHDIIVEALKNGADNYITKPYQAEKIARVINTIDY